MTERELLLDAYSLINSFLVTEDVRPALAHVATEWLSECENHLNEKGPE